MAADIDEAGLARLFGGAGAQPATTTQAAPDAGQPAGQGPSATPVAGPAAAESLDTLAVEAQRHYARAIEAQRAGDWAGYGEAIKQLGATLDRMRGPQDADGRRR